MTEISGPPVAIVGAGFAGLTAAHFLRRNNIPVRLFEAGPRIAGLARSYVDPEGFTYDFGAHFITNRLAAAVGAGSACKVVRYYGESVWLGRTWRSYPLGLLGVPRFLTSAVVNRLASRQPAADESAADRFATLYGPALAKDIAIPLVEAWSGVPACRLSASVADKIGNGIGRTLWLKLAARRARRAVSIGYSNEVRENPGVWHVYPDGGVAHLCEKLARDLDDCIQLDSPVEEIITSDGRVSGIRVQGREETVRAVVSTAPLPFLAKMVKHSAALRPMEAFRYRPMVLVNLCFDTRGILPDTVLWTPGDRFPFFRLTEAIRSMPWLAPPGKTMVTADIGCEAGDATWNAKDEELGALCIDGLERICPSVRAHYLGCRVLRTPVGYPVYLKEYESDRLRYQRSTGIDGLWTIGRNGEFAHILMEDIYWRTVRKMNRLVAEIKAEM